MAVVSNQTQPKVWVNGHYMPANKGVDGKWYVEIDGKRVEVDPNDLFGMNSNLTETPQHFVDYYGKKYAEANEEMSFLEKVGSNIEHQYKEINRKFNIYLSSLGVKKYSEIHNAADKKYAKETFYNNLTDLNSQKISNSNQFFSTSLRAFDYVLQQGNWQNQLNLAQRVEDSLMG